MSKEEIFIEDYLKSKSLEEIRISCVKKGGLGSMELRKHIWPRLLKIYDTPNFMEDWKNFLQDNNYSDIIERDVNRSLFGLDITEKYTDEERLFKRSQLSNILNAVINKNPNLHYFQGFNSICTVFLLLGDEDLGFKMSYQCAELYIKDSMRKNFEDGVSLEMLLIYHILEKIDNKLVMKLKEIYTIETNLNSPMFSLSWVLTWLSHNIHDFETLCRVFDFCLATHPLAPVYIASAIIFTQKSIIMKCHDMPEIHQYVRDLVQQLDIEEVCGISIQMMIKIHPSQLISSSGISFCEE